MQVVDVVLRCIVDHGGRCDNKQKIAICLHSSTHFLRIDPV